MVDVQAGHEKTITGILPALAGANVIYGLGMLEMGITFDLAQLVLDNEIAGMIKCAVGGIPVNDDTLSVDVIKEVGIFQDYLSHDSTFENMGIRSHAKLIDRQMRERWTEMGSTNMYQRAQEKVKDILDTYQPPPLSEEVLSSVRDIIDEAEEELGVSAEVKEEN